MGGDLQDFDNRWRLHYLTSYYRLQTQIAKFFIFGWQEFQL